MQQLQQYLSFLAQHWVLTLLLIVVLVALIVVEMRYKSGGGKSVSPENAVQLINHEQAVVLDIRDKATFKSSGHIINSINIPKVDLDKQAARLKQHQEKIVICVCATGQAAAMVSDKLLKQGFTKVKVLAGGLKAWKEAGLPLEK